MNFLAKTWKRVGRVFNLGVTPEMPLEYAKHVRIFNAIVLLALIAIVPWAITSLVEKKYSLLAAQTCGIIVNILIFYLSVRRRHLLAMGLGLVFLNAYQFMMTVFVDDMQIKGYYMFMVFVILPFILFPRGQKKLLIFFVALGFAGLQASLALRGRFDRWMPVEALSIAQANTMIEYTIFLMSVIVIGASRFFLVSAEARLMEERDRVTRLSAKLKLFLPHQFVESLVKGDRAPEHDYRRKKLTIFFSDIKGFTRWTDTLEPEEVRDLLNRYISDMSDIATKWRGTIDKFVGDAMMVFFGDPESTDDQDHALRCVRMAMAMQERMRELRAKWESLGYEEPLHIRVGVNTGYATVGNFGSEHRLNYTALGGAVNLASRLESASAPDKITISHTTYSLIKDEIECEPKGEIEVKGFSEPVKIYEVVRLKAEAESAKL